jgi:Family of unknown function (DUF5677)
VNVDEFFKAEGFMTECPANILAEIRSFEPELFDACEAVNRWGMEVAWSLKPRKSKPGQVAGALLFVKALNSFQAAVLLARRGMGVESEAMSRTGLECVFQLGALAKEPAKHAKALQSAHHYHLAKHAQKLLEHVKKGAVLEPQVVKELEARTLLKGDTINMEKVAESAGLSHYYDSLYRGSSGFSAHATLGALLRMVVSDGDAIKLQMGPDFDQLGQALIVAAPILIECGRPLASLFGRPELESESEELRAQFERVCRMRRPGGTTGSGGA